MSFIKETIGAWTPADLQSFLQNVVQLEPSQLPPSFNVKALTSDSDIVANGVILTGDPPTVESRAIRDAGIVPGSDQSNPQTIPNGTATKVHFTSHTNYDSTNDSPYSDQWSDNATWVCPVDGLYLIQVGVNWTSNATGIRRLGIHTSDASESDAGVGQGGAFDKPFAFNLIQAASNEQPQVVTGLGYVTAGTNLSVYVYQNSGLSLDLRIEENYSSLTRSRYAIINIVRLGGSKVLDDFII